MPGAIEATARNLRDIAPSIYFNVPKGFEMLLPHLSEDRALRETFFSRLKLMFYAGAGLSQHVHDAFQELATKTVGERIMFLTSLGSTETAPAALACSWESEQIGNIGRQFNARRMVRRQHGEYALAKRPRRASLKQHIVPVCSTPRRYD